MTDTSSLAHLALAASAPYDEPASSFSHLSSTMFSRLAVFSALAFAAGSLAVPAPSGSCNTGPVQCCNSLEEVFHPSRIMVRTTLTDELPGGLRRRLRDPVSDRYRRPGCDRQGRSRVLAHLCHRRWNRERVLCSAGLLPEQQRGE